MVSKLNCWEFFQCGREPAGSKVAELGLCSAATDLDYDGANGGEAAGRFCWMIAGTFCRGEQQGSHTEKYADCILCPFMEQVAEEEGRFLILTREDFRKSSLDRLQGRGD